MSFVFACRYRLDLLTTCYKGLTSSCEYAIRDPSDDSGIVNCSNTTVRKFHPLPSAIHLRTLSGHTGFGGSDILSVSHIFQSVIYSGKLTSSPYSQNATSSSSASPSSTSAASSSSPASATTSSHSSNTGAIVGGVVGGVAGVALILFGIFFFLRRRRQSSVFSPTEKWALDRPGPRNVSPYTEPYIYEAFPLSTTPPTSSSAYSNASVDGKKGTVQHSPVVLSYAEPERREPYGASVPQNTSTPATAPQPSVPLDQIVEGLAQRFGWTSPRRGEHDEPLPQYRD